MKHVLTSSRQMFLALAAACMIVAGGIAQAQEWPSRPVSLVVAYEPGGIVDITARLIADHLSKAFPQSFIVENRAGRRRHHRHPICGACNAGRPYAPGGVRRADGDRAADPNRTL